MSAPSGYTALDFVGFTDKGTYSPIVNYMRNDLVHYGGNIMRCLIDNTKNVTPVVGANWELWVGASANLVERVIAPLENNPADVAFGVGRQIIYDDWLWEVIAPIEVGDALIDYAVDPTNANIKKSAPVETQLLAVKAEADATDNMIAPTEASASSSSAAYSIGDQLILNNILYDVIAAIQIGDALTTGTGGNIKAADNLTDQLKEVDSQIQTLTNNDDAMINVLGAKNLLQCNNTTQTVRGITYQKNSDGSIYTSGSVASGYDYSYFHVNESQKLPKGKYILSGCYPNGSIDKWRLYIGANGTNYIDYGEGVEFELAEDATVDAIIRIESGYVSDGMTFYPMIRPASIANDTYVPYAKTNRQLTEGEVEDISSHFILNTTNVASAIVVAYKTGKVVTFNMVFTPIAGITNLGNKQFLVIDSGYRPKHKTVSEYDFYQAVWFEDVASSDTTYAVVMRIVAETGSFETPNNRGYIHTTNANSRVFVSGSYEVE